MTDLKKFTEKNIKRIGERIRALRKVKGYSNQEHFAYKFDIARAQYSRWERGVDLKLSSLSRILHAHNMSLPEFFAEGFEEETESEPKKSDDE